MSGDPLWINASAGAPAYTANELRQAMALGIMYGGRLLGARQGVRPGGDQLKTSLSVSTITVKAGLACVDPALTTAQGPYWVALPTDETHTLTAADATNPRKDITILRVYDHDEDASGLRLVRSEYLVGTPNPSPSEPAVPAGAIRLATIDVPAQGGGSAAVTDRRRWTVAPGGVLPVVDQAERDALGKWAGLVVYRIDTDEFQYWDGANWHFIPIKLTVGGTTPIVADVGSFTTTETVVATTTVSLVSGRKYRVRFVGGWQTTVADSSITTKIREDNVSGTIREFRVIPADRSTGSFFHPFALEFIHTAAATGSKTFVGTGVRFSGTGTVSLDAGNDHPAYLYVEYVSE